MPFIDGWRDDIDMWVEYLGNFYKVIKIEEYKLEIKGLNEQIDILKKQNEELTAGINFVKNPST